MNCWTRRSIKRLMLFALGSLVIAIPVTAQAPWPGQSGNAVGYAAYSGWTAFSSTACPSSPASGTSWSNATIVQNCTYSGITSVTFSCSYCEFINVDFVGATGGGNVNFTGANVLVLADRFQSNEVGGGAVGVTGTNVYLFYNTMEPLLSFYTSPPGYTWPSAGAGANSTTITEGTNAINGNDGYEYGINLQSSNGPVVIDHCEIWGAADSIVLPSGSTGQITITNNFMHDIPNPTETSAHTDGPGYTNGAVGPDNVEIIGNTTAQLGNTQALALQQATGGYANIYVAENFWSGNGATIGWCMPGSVQCTNSYFYGNVFGTDVAPGGPTYGPIITVGTGSVWACNTISVRPGTTWTDQNDTWTPTSAMDGQFFFAQGSGPFVYNSTTDYGGNTLCAVPSPSTYNFGAQASGTSSAGQAITLSNTNTASLAISSIALATGTQFAITSNTCGSTLASGSNCTITVKFTPTVAGPQTDTLKITDNTPGVSSPQLVPLAGIGTGASNFSALNAPTGLRTVVQ